MSSWAADLVKNLTGVVLGWALGLASTPVVEWRKKRKRLRSTKIAISRDLGELAHRLLMVVYSLELSRGELDRATLEWLQPHVRRYAGPNPTDNVLASIEMLLKASDSQTSQVSAYEQARTPPGFLPREEASYASSAAAEAHDFEPDYALRLLDIPSHLRMYNEVRADALHYHHLTFEPGVTDDNHTLAVRNLDSANEHIAMRARVLVEKITALTEKYPPGE